MSEDEVIEGEMIDLDDEVDFDDDGIDLGEDDDLLADEGIEMELSTQELG